MPDEENKGRKSRIITIKNNKDMETTSDDMKTLSSLIIGAMEEIEVCVSLTEEYFCKIYEQSKDFQRIKKRYGLAAAKAATKEITRKQIRGEQVMMIGRFLQDCKRFHTMMEKVMDAVFDVSSLDAVKTFDAVMHDANYRAFVNCLVMNVPDEKLLQMESTLKVLGREPIVRSELINHFKEQAEQYYVQSDYPLDPVQRDNTQSQ